jgi:hypothetical protein
MEKELLKDVQKLTNYLSSDEENHFWSNCTCDIDEEERENDIATCTCESNKNHIFRTISRINLALCNLKDDVRVCCDKEMLRVETEGMMQEAGVTWVCPYCFNTVIEREEQGDSEDIINILGIDKEDIKDFDTITDEELTKEIIRLYKEVNK